MKAQPSDLPDGYYVVAPGKLVNAVTWLEMRARPEVIANPLRLLMATDRDACRDLYAAVGTPWLWSRACAPDPPSDASSRTYFALDDEGSRAGVVELTDREPREIEITYFGLLPHAIGRGLGRRMMAAALEFAWARATRVWLHTCSFDHPAAPRFYLACGFAPYAIGFEIMDDPRLKDALPRAAAPHVPLLPILR